VSLKCGVVFILMFGRLYLPNIFASFLLLLYFDCFIWLELDFLLVENVLELCEVDAAIIVQIVVLHDGADLGLGYVHAQLLHRILHVHCGNLSGVIGVELIEDC